MKRYIHKNSGPLEEKKQSTIDKLMLEYLDPKDPNAMKYFVICTMNDEIIDYGEIYAFSADDAMCDFLDDSGIVYSGDYEDEDGEFDWDNLTRYVWAVSDDEVLPKTDSEAQAWLNTNVDEDTLVEDKAAEAPATKITDDIADAMLSDYLDEDDNSKEATKDKSLLEYTDLQSWQDEIDQIQTKEDADKIPQWVLDRLGITRASIMPKTVSSAKPADTPATSNGDYIDKDAAEKFWGNATKKIIDTVNFHKAFDDNLKDMQFDMSAFNSDGLLVNQGTYGKIKSLDPNNSATKAIKRLWGLQFKEQGKILTQAASTEKTVDEPKFIKEVEELIFEAMPNVDSEAARDLIEQRKNSTGYRISYGFKFDSTGKVVWSWYDDSYDWPWGYTLSTDLGYNPFTKSEAEVAADIMIAVENNEISKE